MAVKSLKSLKTHQGMGTRRANQLLNAGRHLVLAFFSVVILYPVFWMVMASLKRPAEITTNLWGAPQVLQFVNYTFAWQKAGMGAALFNSTFVSISVVILVVSLSSLAAYALARLPFKLSAALFIFFVFTMQAPIPLIPMYVLIVKL